MVRWGVPTAVLAVASIVVAVLATRRVDVMAPAADGSIKGLTSVLDREITADIATIRMHDATRDAGIDFIHFPGTRRSLLPEDMGSGVAWGDMDDDGDPDLFLVNYASSMLEPIDAHGDAGLCRLYRNDGGAFVDVTHDVGLDAPIRGCAAAWCDYDGDGDLDLYITAYGPNRLYRNDGGLFEDVSREAGVDDSGFGAGVAWFDADGDEWIDLYVCNYVDFEYREGDLSRRERQYGAEVPFTLNPSSYPAQPNRLYRNNRDGTFTDVAAESGVADPRGRSLGAAPFDFDLDGDIDLYVANDVSANGVFRNRGDGTFEDIGAISLAADYRGAMGMAVGDLDRDSDFDLFVTHWVAQENACFENMHSENWIGNDGERRLFFMDTAELLGLGQISLKTVGWSTGFADFDNDGLDDLWVVNGHTLEDADDPTRLRPQAMQLFRQIAGEGFFEVAEQACGALCEPMVGRGGASADYDGDGRVDLVLVGHGEPVRLVRNSTPAGNAVRLRLRQPAPNTRALGARVQVSTTSGTQAKQIGASAAYLSQDGLDLAFGVGAETHADVQIVWPDGETLTLPRVEAGPLLEVVRARGSAPADGPTVPFRAAGAEKTPPHPK